MRLHPGAWTVWLASAAVAGFAVSNPLYLLVALGAIAIVQLSGPPDHSPAGRAFRTFVVLGSVLVVVRIALVALVADAGRTTLVTLPALELPVWLGAVELGGPVTAEVLVEAASEGLRLVVVLAAVGVYNARVDLAGIVRTVPGPLRDAGLVVSIAAGFVPGLMRTVGDVRDAQRLRGERGRVLAPSLAVPVLAMSLERALLVAESMDVRGYGRATGPPPSRPVVTGGMLAMLAGVAAWVAGAAVAGSALTAAGGIAIFAALRRAAATARVTRLARPAWGSADIVVAALAVAASFGVVVLDTSFTAYPVVSVPAFEIAAVAPVLALAAPAYAGTLR